MSPRQRYISKELTHFVGAGLRGQPDYETRQYELMTTILRSGSLKPRPDFPKGVVAISIRNILGQLSTNEAYVPYCVCFADIPEGDFDLHIEKYSRFGLGFQKPFLIEQGANPMFYVANNKQVARSAFTANQARLSDESDAFWNAYRRLEEMMWGPISGQIRELLEVIHKFLGFHVFPYLKFFDDGLPDEDHHNYYMEREWRVLGTVRFRLSDVRRIVLPEEFSSRFRQDFPDYSGQLTFAPTG